MSNRKFYFIFTFAFLMAMGLAGKVIDPDKPVAATKAAAPVAYTSQYDKDRAFCSEWSGFCGRQGYITPEMMKR